jgi:hypothetical protein
LREAESGGAASAGPAIRATNARMRSKGKGGNNLISMLKPPSADDLISLSSFGGEGGGEEAAMS